MSDWINVDTSGKNANGHAAALMLESVAGSLQNAPEGARFDFEVVVDQRRGGDE